MGVFLPVLLSTITWSLQPGPAFSGQFPTHEIIQQPWDRMKRSAVMDFQPKPPASSTEMVPGDWMTSSNVTEDHVTSVEPLNHSTSTEDSESSTSSAEAATLTSTLTSALTSTSEASPSNETTAESEEDYYYFDYDTESTVHDDITTLSSQVISDKATVEPSSSDRTDTSQMAHSYIVANNSRTVGRALSTHKEDDLLWEPRSTKVTDTFLSDAAADEYDGGSLATGTIIAICVAIFITFMLAGGSGYWWYRRRFTNQPESLNDRYAASEAGNSATDDIFRVGYIHHPELPKDSSEEMYSLDNDSFLTSLEAMTIPNYWTENIKHTKL